MKFRPRSPNVVRDEQLILDAIRDGDTEAFAELINAHQARVRWVCLIWLGHQEEADDAAQDIFFKAFKALNQFKRDSSFQTWILRITDNYCRDLLRTRTLRKTESLDALLDEKGDAIEQWLARSAGTEDLTPYGPQDLELLGRLFAALPEDDREILILREVEELLYEAIAERLRCSLDAVKGRLKRARQTLIEKCGSHLVDTSSAPARLKE